MAASGGGGYTYDPETVRVVARVRKLLADGYTLSAIAGLTGWTKDKIWKIKAGRRHRQVSLPLNELKLRKPSRQGVLCRKCGHPPRIFAQSGLCVECELFEMHKIGLVVISEPESQERG